MPTAGNAGVAAAEYVARAGASVRVYAPKTTPKPILTQIVAFGADHFDGDLARELGISVGKANYCVRALMEKGLIKANNFKNSRNKKAYMYLLTPRGIVEKTHITSRFLQRKMAEYEALRQEIETLKREVRG